MSDGRAGALIRTPAAAIRSVVPDWLAEVVRPRPARPPWPEMIRAALAISVPLAVGFGVGKSTLGVLPAIGGLIGATVDNGGPYLTRVKRVTAAGVLGGAPGLAIGAVTHGHGWLAVLALVVVAGVSALISSVSDAFSVAGLQLLVYTGLGFGPLGAERPVWHTVVGFLVGVAWAIVLILPGWLLSPHGKEQRDVAAVYDALARMLGSIGTDGFTTARQQLTTALNTAYDELLTARSTSPGRNRRIQRLAAALNASHLLAEATVSLGVAGIRLPPLIIETVQRLGDSIRDGTPPPMIPPAWDTSPPARALRDALASTARVLLPDWSPSGGGRGRSVRGLADRLRQRMSGLPERLADGVGRQTRIFAVRLMVCMGAAGVVTEVIALQRSYWVPLTVAIVLKPDFGSVFARALQRGIGTVVGAVVGAIILILIHGTWLLIPFAVLAALLPYGRSRNYGLFATFLTPLVVVLIDLFSPVGWQLAEDRLLDTVIGCGIVLVLGFAPWPMVWYAHLPRRFGQAALDVARYMEAALLPPDPAAGGTRTPGVPPARSRLRRSTYRALADVRAEFQRTLSEPPAISRRAAAWWPALVTLERLMDTVTSTALAVGSASLPPDGVRALADAVRAVGEASLAGEPLADVPELPDDESLKPVTEVVRALLDVLGSGSRVGAAG